MEAQISTSPDSIIEKICKLSGFSKEAILSESKGREVAFYRQLAMIVLSTKGGLSMAAAARKLNRKDHTTVIHAKKCIRDFIDTGYRKEEIDFFLTYDY
jgi:chromosomal replication initiator protein